MITGRRNCRRCSRWRPIHDFPYYDHRGGVVTSVRWICSPCQRARRRWLQAVRMQNPAWVEKRREADRETAAMKRRDAGIPVRSVGKNNNGGYGAGRLEHEEQQAWYDADGFRRLLVVQGWSAVEAAQRTGVSDTTLLRIMDGRQEMIGDDVADRIAVALDHPLATIAPEGPVRYTARHNGGGRRK